jgi:hypothetical protein
MAYQIREPDRAALLSWLEQHLTTGADPVDALAFDRRTGRAQQQIGQLDAEVLAQLDPEDVIRECLERWCSSPGRWQFRILFQQRDDDGQPVGKARQLRRSVDIRREGTAGSTASTGGAAGIETLATSYGGAFDRLSTQVSLGNQRTDELSARLIDWQHEYSETRLTETADYQQQIAQLSIDLARAEMQIAIMEDRTPAIPAEVWIQLVPAGVQLLQGIAGKLTGSEALASAAAAVPLEGASTGAEPASGAD